MELRRTLKRTVITARVERMGDGWIVRLENEAAHIGAVAVGEYDDRSGRASVSVLTRLGHKEDSLALHAAHDLAKQFRGPVCVIAGIHLDDIAPEEIIAVQDAVKGLISEIGTAASPT